MASKYDSRSYGWSDPSYNSQGSSWNAGYNKTNDDYVPNFAFSNASIRGKFISRVFSTVAAQLALTVGLIALFQFHEGALLFAFKNTWMLNLAMISTLGLTLLMSFSTSIRRTAPLNMLVLGAYTLCQGFLIALVTTMYEVSEVLYAIGITTAIVIGLAVYASTTKEDFTVKGGMFISALMALSIGSLISIFYRGEFFLFVLSVGGAAVFSCYLVYDLQMIMGDKTLKISPEEYIFASLSLYVDIVRIFMEILKIMRYLNENQQNQRDRRKRN